MRSVTGVEPGLGAWGLGSRCPQGTAQGRVLLRNGPDLKSGLFQLLPRSSRACQLHESLAKEVSRRDFMNFKDLDGVMISVSLVCSFLCRAFPLWKLKIQAVMTFRSVVLLRLPVRTQCKLWSKLRTGTPSTASWLRPGTRVETGLEAKGRPRRATGCWRSQEPDPSTGC